MMGCFWQVNGFYTDESLGTGETYAQNMAGAIYFMTVVQMFLNF